MGMTRRGLVGLLALGLLLGGTAACSDEDGGGGGGDGATETTTTATTAAGDGETGEDGGAGDTEGEDTEGEETEVVAANDAIIQEYCDAQLAYDELLEDSTAAPDDAGIQAQLREASGRLGEASDAVSPVVETFTPEQQAQFEECSS